MVKRKLIDSDELEGLEARYGPFPRVEVDVPAVLLGLVVRVLLEQLDHVGQCRQTPNGRAPGPAHSCLAARRAVQCDVVHRLFTLLATTVPSFATIGRPPVGAYREQSSHPVTRRWSARGLPS